MNLPLAFLPLAGLLLLFPLLLLTQILCYQNKPIRGHVTQYPQSYSVLISLSTWSVAMKACCCLQKTRHLSCSEAAIGQKHHMLARRMVSWLGDGAYSINT